MDSIVGTVGTSITLSGGDLTQMPVCRLVGAQIRGCVDQELSEGKERFDVDAPGKFDERAEGAHKREQSLTLLAGHVDIFDERSVEGCEPSAYVLGSDARGVVGGNNHLGDCA